MKIGCTQTHVFTCSPAGIVFAEIPENDASYEADSPLRQHFWHCPVGTNVVSGLNDERSVLALLSEQHAPRIQLVRVFFQGSHSYHRNLVTWEVRFPRDFRTEWRLHKIHRPSPNPSEPNRRRPYLLVVLGEELYLVDWQELRWAQTTPVPVDSERDDGPVAKNKCLHSLGRIRLWVYSKPGDAQPITFETDDPKHSLRGQLCCRLRSTDVVAVGERPVAFQSEIENQRRFFVHVPPSDGAFLLDRRECLAAVVSPDGSKLLYVDRREEWESLQLRAVSVTSLFPSNFGTTSLLSTTLRFVSSNPWKYDLDSLPLELKERTLSLNELNLFVRLSDEWKPVLRVLTK